MAVAKPRQAIFRPGRVVPLLTEDRAPLKNACAAVAAKSIPERGFLAGDCTLALSLALALRDNSPNAVAPAAMDAVPGRRRSRTAGFGFEAANFSPSLVFLISIQKALPATNDACNEVRCASSSTLAVASQARRLAWRVPRWRK